MSEDLLRYDLMIEAALRDVVRETMETVARDGFVFQDLIASAPAGA